MTVLVIPSWAFWMLICLFALNACASIYKGRLMQRLAQRQDGRVESLLADLRGVRDIQPHGEARSALNDACDKLDVALSKLRA